VRLTHWIRYGGTVAAASVLLWRLPTGALQSALRELDGPQLLPAFFCALAMMAVRVYKWHRLVGESESGVGASLRPLFGGFALSLIIPGRLGEFGRCWFAAKPARARVALLNILDRALDEWALLTLTVASLFVVVARPAAIFGVGVWLAGLPVVLGLPTLISKLCVLPCWPEHVRAQIAAATPGLTRVRTAPFALLSLASTFLELLLLFSLLRAFHRVGFSVALAVYPWITMAGAVPVSLSGLGVREGAAALLLPRYGIPPAVAVEVGLLMFAFNSLLPGALGGLWLLVDRRQQGMSWRRSLGRWLGRVWIFLGAAAPADLVGNDPCRQKTRPVAAGFTRLFRQRL
jgi:uncharacterized membrane protein YbhN (UPF0104 family)